MKKKVFLILSCVLFVCVAVGVCLYAIPDRLKINDTLQATKLDKDGNVIGSAQIALQGSYKKYLFGEDVFELSVAPFGEMKNINFVDADETAVSLGTIGDEFYRISGTAWDNSKGDIVFVTVTMSMDFGYWVFYVHDNEKPVYYVASSADHTVEEIVQYFKGLAPGYKAA